MINNINQISHIDNEKCNKCVKTNTCIHKTRNKFIKRCLPFNNFDESKKNILNFDKSSYIYFYKKNVATYYLKKDFSIKLIRSTPPPSQNIDILSEEILLSVFNIDDIEIPGYYLFCNYTHIFNIFITYYSEWINHCNSTIMDNTQKLDKLQEEYKHFNLIFENIKAKSNYNNIESENIQIYKQINIYELQLKELQLKDTQLKELQLKDTQLKELQLKELQLKDTQLKDIQLKDTQLKELSKEIIYNKTNKIIQQLDILKKKLKDNKQKLKLILEELKKNKEYIKCDNELKAINKHIKNLNESIERTKYDLSALLKTITNIFQINNNNNFIKLSYMFNIFNISILCEKYFDIIKLLLNEKNITLEDIIEIFKDFYLVNIYYLINYKKNIKQINNDKIFMNNKIKSNNLYNISNNKNDIYKNIINIEQNMNNITEINNSNIYRELHLQLEYIHIILNKIEQYIPNYKKLFLMAIISYRNNNNLINNTWGYLNKKYIYDFIINNTTYIYHKSNSYRYSYNDDDNDSYNDSNNDDDNDVDTLKKYYKPTLPILYDYDNVTYKNMYYGNCMENTILQFLKVLFWNKEANNYDLNKMKEIINAPYKEFITNMFIDIYNEKTLKFINNWTEFITEITNNKIYGDYIFDNQYERVEIRPTLNNLIIALKYLVQINDNNNDNITFMSQLITKINKDYKININSEVNYDKIELIFNEKIYIIILDHENHASFEGTLYEDYNNILNYLDYNDFDENNDLDENDKNDKFLYKLANYLYDLQFITFSNLNAYIIYLYFCNNNNIFYSYITKINNREKVYLINLFINKFKRLNNIMYYLIFQYKNILDFDNISNISNNIIDNIINNYYYNNNILELSNNIQKLANNKDIIDLLSDDNIYDILKLNIDVNTINKSYLIVKLKDYDLYRTFSNKLWLKIIYDYNMIFELINIILEDLSLIDNWSSSEWISIIHTYTNIKYNSDLDSDNTLLLSNIEKLLQHKYNSFEETDELINNVIFNMTESEWINIFTNIDFNLYKSFYNAITKYIFSSELYKKWINDDTWFKYLININNMLIFDDNEENITYIKSILPLDYICTKNINWSELNTFLVKVF